MFCARRLSFYACFLLFSLTWSLELSRKRKKTVKSFFSDVVRPKHSQNTALERLHKDFAGGIPVYYKKIFCNNAANACAFISVTLAHLLLSDTGSTNILQHAMQDKIIKTAKLL